jgi:hypothetical protein
MKPFLMPSPPLFVVLAGLACVFGAPACADQANPVLPPSGGHGGLTAGGGGTTGAIDAQTPSDAEDTAPYVPADASTSTCDLLKQDCPKNPITQVPQGCYPVSGSGRCEPVGETGEFGTCSADTDCTRGLVCVRQSPGDSFSYCQPICDLRSDATSSVCSIGLVCQSMSGFTNVGRCTATL